jgi:hypothetical protein
LCVFRALQQLWFSWFDLQYSERDNAIVVITLWDSKFQTEKAIVDRHFISFRSGITFKTNVNVGLIMKFQELNNFDSVVLCGGTSGGVRQFFQGIRNKVWSQTMDFYNNKPKHYTVNQFLIKSKQHKNIYRYWWWRWLRLLLERQTVTWCQISHNFENFAKPPGGVNPLHGLSVTTSGSLS